MAISQFTESKWQPRFAGQNVDKWNYDEAKIPPLTKDLESQLRKKQSAKRKKKKQAKKVKKAQEKEEEELREETMNLRIVREQGMGLGISIAGGVGSHAERAGGKDIRRFADRSPRR